ncbi:MAG: hypothetical protein POG74_06860 [Acidocella sp.]|nr:hypothetical protein [Acidocella sp.]
MSAGSRVLHGLFLLVRGKTAGLADFANTNNALTASLAPLIAFPLVGAFLVAMRGDVNDALVSFIAQLCVALAPSLLIYEFARIWRAEADWMRTASALNWSFWVALPLLLAGALLASVLVTLGTSEIVAEAIVIGLVGGYLMWLHWFIVRKGLNIGVWQAILLVFVTNMVLGLLVVGPDLINLAMGGKITAFMTG